VAKAGAALGDDAFAQAHAGGAGIGTTEVVSELLGAGVGRPPVTPA
jgi:hypothetical protein